MRQIPEQPQGFQGNQVGDIGSGTDSASRSPHAEAGSAEGSPRNLSASYKSGAEEARTSRSPSEKTAQSDNSVDSVEKAGNLREKAPTAQFFNPGSPSHSDANSQTSKGKRPHEEAEEQAQSGDALTKESVIDTISIETKSTSSSVLDQPR